MHPLPTLNYDILHLLMSFSSKREVCNMMATCKTLHREGAKFLLHDVILQDERDIRSFTQFIAADPYRRIRYWRTLKLTCGSVNPDTALLLRVLLEFAAPFLGLKYLRLHEPDNLLGSDLALIQAFSRIPHISMLRFSAPGALLFDLLQRMSGCVHTAILDCERSGAVHPLEESNPILALRALRNTLVEISGYGVKANTTSDLCAGVVFPHVRKLRLETSDAIDSAEYARAFPNLAVLYFSCRYSIHGGIDEEERAELSVHRERNRTLLRERGGWSLLESYNGSPIDLWALGLDATVERLRLFMGPMHDGQQTIVSGVFEELMRDIRVKHIHLDVWMSRAVHDTLTALSRTCRELHHLGLYVVFNPKELLTDVTAMLDALVEYAGCGSLQSLDVSLQCMDIIPLPLEDDAEMSPVTLSPGECVRILDLDTLAARIHSRAPSLRNISLDLWIQSEEVQTLRRGDEIPSPEQWEWA
ncbi:hypothetical protein OH76DRAFT_1483837 [Lentinus brumalis]|uniref:F-box domain-containing protein n=1 Tax=Lentinus brumalis TaxID=2498619 RepID=A0A371D7I3_9APHY|nr:hypothetical protein OH76DRAFT_1483837 [Polyporus brumalis]